MITILSAFIACEVADITYTLICVSQGWCTEMNPLQHIVGWPVFTALKFAVILGVPWVIWKVYDQDKSAARLLGLVTTLIAAAPVGWAAYQLYA